MSKQPEALRLAEFCDGNVLYHPCAAELRRQHALIEEMKYALLDVVSIINELVVFRYTDVGQKLIAAHPAISAAIYKAEAYK